jgi:sugar/nucleoside kinase (ribokinase family)
MGILMAAEGPSGAQTLRVVVVGDVMVDVLAMMSGPLARGSDTPARVSTGGGGSAANVAAWLAAQGVHTTYVGRVGDDTLGREAVAALGRYDVDVRVGTSPDRPTGTCLVLVEPGGERSMLPDTGANATLSPGDLPEEVFRPGSHLHLSGYTLLHEESRPAGVAAVQLAREVGMTVSVDPSSAALLEAAGPDRFAAWTGVADLLLANADEARALSAVADPRDAAAALCSSYKEVVVKLGADGALWHGGFIGATAPAERGVQVVDTTGAGDAFAAGFLTSWLLHPEPESALAAGNRLAAWAVGRLGARPPLTEGTPEEGGSAP